MICKYCGASLPDGSTKCDYCGAILAEQSNTQVSGATPNYQQTNPNPADQNYYTTNNYQGQGQNYQGQNNQDEGSGSLGVASLICGVLSLLTCCSGILSLILGILAIVFASIEKKKSGVRKAGLITGIIGTIICLIMLGISLVLGSLFTEENLNKFLEGLSEEIEKSEEFQDFKESDEYKDLLKELENLDDDDYNDTKTETNNNTSSLNTTSNVDWAISTLEDGIYVCTYANGIPDSYMMSDKGSFKNVSEWLDYATPGYPVETFRQVVSVYCLNSDSYNKIATSSDEDTRNYTLALLSSIAWQINNDFGGKVKAAEIDPYNMSIIDFIIDSNIGSKTVVLRWDSKNNTLQMKNQDSEKFIEYGTTTFDTNRLAPLMVAIEEALKGEKVG